MPWQVPHQPYTVWKICIAILHCVAITVSAFRIWLRYRSSRLWWDDYLVILPVLVDIFYCTTLLVIPPPGPTPASIVKSSNYWLGLFPSLTVVWLSRICFLLLLIRFFPPRHLYRRITLALVVIFSLTHLTLIALYIPLCDGVHSVPPPALRSSGKKNCRKSARINVRLVFGLASDLLSDLILVIWPLLTLYKVKLSRPKDRPIVIVSLGCSIFTFLLLLVLVVLHCAPITQDANYRIVLCMLAHMMATVALMACNMPVVACAVYRAFQRARGVHGDSAGQMPDASQVPSDRAYESGSAGMSRPTFESKSAPTIDTRFTYDDLTRITMSYDMSELQASPIATSDAKPNPGRTQP